ncbi:MAG TPA: TadE/TadG family type IV pilus assembly protein [Dehalococcoidia bacterium]|nr:TadE/TadG family type IV pilus assembly protein [Dehalococcoidia bacterium]
MRGAHVWQRHRRDRERGQSLVELSIALPVLLVLLLGAVDFGRLYYASVTVAGAARNGAQYASENPNDTAGIRAAALEDAGTLNPQPTVTVTGPDADATGGRYIGVRVQHTFHTLVPWPGIPSSVDISRQVVMRVVE